MHRELSDLLVNQRSKCQLWLQTYVAVGTSQYKLGAKLSEIKWEKLRDSSLLSLDKIKRIRLANQPGLNWKQWEGKIT